MTNAASANHKKTAIILVVVFVLPVVLAKFALEFDWFNRGATNRGELLDPVIDFSNTLSQQPSQWRLFYLLPSHCDESCQNALVSMQQVWLALGRENDRVKPVVAISAESDAAAIKQLSDQVILHTIKVSADTLPASLNSNTAGAIYLIDPLNLAMLRFLVPAEKELAVQNGRDILADTKRLLKLSRIG